MQQGDPLGPLCFALAIDPVIQSLQSSINLWYLDDGTLAGPYNQVLADAKTLIDKFAEVGLKLNPSKYELVNLSASNPASEQILALFNRVLPEIKSVQKDDMKLLGSSILEGSLLSVEKAKGLI